MFNSLRSKRNASRNLRVFLENFAYRDEHPAKTINNAKRILRSLRLSTVASPVREHHGFLYSCSIRIRGTTLLARGKGVTRQYALASAYGELLERLQNLINFHRIELRPSAAEAFGFIYEPNERNFSSGSLPSLPSDFHAAKFDPGDKSLFELWEDFRCQLTDSRSMVTYVPFYSFSGDTVEYLPVNFLHLIYGSNGMAAGNTPAEAIAHGLSEILERHVMKRLYFDEITPPTVPLEYIARNAPFQYSIIKALEESGEHRVIVKDCSLGMSQPVVGVILIFKRTNTYTVNLGASAIWQIALERCLTEMFQGHKAQTYKGSRPINLVFWPKGPELYENYKNILATTSGQYPAAIFGRDFDYELRPLPVQGPRTQKECLSELVNCVLQQGHNIYIRDVTYTDLYAYQIIVPGMSEVKEMSGREWSAENHCFSRLDYICNLDRLPVQELRRLAGSMENYLTWEGSRKNVMLGEYVGMPVAGTDPWNIADLRLVLSLVCHKLGEVGKAFRTMVEYVDQEPRGAKDEIERYCIARDMLGLSSKTGKAFEEVAEVLIHLYDREMVEEVLEGVRCQDKVLRSSLMPRGVMRRKEEVCRKSSYRNMEAVFLRLKRAINDNRRDQMDLRRIIKDV